MRLNNGMWWMAFWVGITMAALIGWNAIASSVQGLSKSGETVTVHGRDGSSGRLSLIEKDTARATLNVGSSTNVASATLSDRLVPYLKIGGWCLAEIGPVTPMTLTAASNTATRLRIDFTDIPTPTNRFGGSAEVEDGSGHKPAGVFHIDSDTVEIVWLAEGGTGANTGNVKLSYLCE